MNYTKKNTYCFKSGFYLTTFLSPHINEKQGEVCCCSI